MKRGFLSALLVVVVGCGPTGEELVKLAEQDFKDGNDEEAVAKIQKAADKKYPKGMLALGGLYLVGNKIEPDHEKGFALIREAAELKDPDSMFALSGCYKSGLGTKIDLHKAEYWKQQAVDAGSQAAISDLATEAFFAARKEWTSRRFDSKNRNRYVPSDLEKRYAKKALELFDKITEEKAQVGIWKVKAEMHLEGIGCDPSPSKAEKWYKKGVEAGDEQSMRVLGIEYCSGKRMRRNCDDGVALLKKAMKKKDRRCSTALGYAYLDPKWSHFDLNTGISYLEDAIELAKDEEGASNWEMYVEDELYTLGRIYAYEEESGANFDKGVEYLTLAAKHYHSEASNYLAVLYFNGDGVKQDMEKVWDYSSSGKSSKDARIKDASTRLYEVAKKLYFAQ